MEGGSVKAARKVVRFRWLKIGGDELELERLVQTCPRLVCRMDDAAFTDRVAAARAMAVAVALDLGPRLAKVRMLAAVRETPPHAVGLGVDAGVPDPGSSALSMCPAS